MAASIPSPVRDAGLPDRFRLDSLTVHVDPPLAVVDLPAFDANADDLVRRAGGTPIRVATKSVRCRTLIDRALARPGFSGLMTYSLAEAVRLVDSGHDDVLMAYPTADRGAIEALLADERRTAATTLMVDSTEQLDLVDAVSGPDHRPSVRVCVDIDTSLRVGRAWLGARRSPLRTPAEVAAAVGALAARRGVQVVGLMTYEAQVAGLPDTSPAVRAVKRASLRELGGRRAAILSAVRDVVDLELVNAGGTGSLETSAADPGVTEVTAGSGLFGPGLFTGYDTFSPRAAALFALPVVRRPSAEVATCLSGGYVASGPAGADRLPRPVLPTGLRLVNGEGAGEVQTPVRGAAARHLRIGDRVWFRHAKAGEMCERFDRLHLLEADRHAGDVATYRGEGWNFG